MNARLTVLLAALALALAGCGDSDDGATGAAGTTAKPPVTEGSPQQTETTERESTTPSEPRSGRAPSKPDFVAAADRTCRAARRDGLGIKSVGRTSAGLRKLQPPKGDELEVERYALALDSVIGVRRRLRDARRGKNNEDIAFLSEALETAEERARTLARSYGFKACRAG
jgi:hypothetical protein